MARSIRLSQELALIKQRLLDLEGGVPPTPTIAFVPGQHVVTGMNDLDYSYTYTPPTT